MIHSAMLAIKSHRARAQSQRWMADAGLTRLNQPLIDRFGDRVISGPFRGMKLTPMTRKEHLGPYLLGTYENEIHSVIEALMVGPKPSVILDIGAKFGYYAVGFARRLPDTPVIAFDTDWWARKAMRQMIEANNTANVRVYGECERVRFGSLPFKPLIFCDIDGGELALFAGQPAMLANATLTIETHDFLVPDTTTRLAARFEPTHRITRFDSATTLKTPPVDFTGVFSEPDDTSRACSEIRPPQSWLYLTPRY